MANKRLYTFSESELEALSIYSFTFLKTSRFESNFSDNEQKNFSLGLSKLIGTSPE